MWGSKIKQQKINGNKLLPSLCRHAPLESSESQQPYSRGDKEKIKRVTIRRHTITAFS